MRKLWPLKIVGFIIVGTLVFGLATMGLWNYLMPFLFHLPELTFIQAVALVLLARILVGGFGPRGGCGGGTWRHHWKARWEEKMASLTLRKEKSFVQNGKAGVDRGISQRSQNRR